MKKRLFDTVSHKTSELVTKTYSTSFSIATKMLPSKIRKEIYNIYGFVRFADEIVDSFHNYDKEKLLNNFERDMYQAIEDKISLNPILNAFQKTVNHHDIPLDLIQAFLKSMRWDLHKSTYLDKNEINEYIYGSADVIGLMCLKIFVNGNKENYEKLRTGAMSLGSAFQKVNFLRDLKEDLVNLDRSYFPHIKLDKFDETSKQKILREIEKDFRDGYKHILELPNNSKFGVYLAYVYYKKLFSKLKKTPSEEIISTRIRISNFYKVYLLIQSYLNYHLNFIIRI